MGGCWWLLFPYPNWLQTFVRLSPHVWATTGFNMLLVFGAGFSAVVPEMIAVAAFAVVFGLITVWHFRTAAN